ncbi:MAG: ABC transporter substrate-binding protein [Reyranella sp.]|uniref:ABC transporter substrate-binding protein n=1 Tax=Reyranella sp. TaxID=1929291 RepID=UPI00273202F5|nr:ABC transporter substrate-binding protein [Reyranella sp.]MDP1962916.1 ABC transporter substrate-binding protein [Reyranella sp.]MDP2378652.1 ABC transporter substrate-binding protein [Reyranella sp.]
MKRMSRRALALVLLVIVASEPAFAQRPDGVPIVGALFLGSEESEARRLEALRDGLRSNGLIEGVAVHLVARYADSDADRLVPLARELAAAGSRLIVTIGTTSVRAVQTALPGMPIVMNGSADPVETGIVRSLSRPGGKITGISILGSGLIGKRVEILKELVPTAKTFAALLHSANPGNEVFRQALATAAQALQVEIQVRETRTLEEITAALAWAARLPAGGVLLIEDPTFLQYREAIFRAALAERLPTVSGNVGFANAGALAVYAPDSLAISRESGRYIAAILRGADPGELAIAQPTKFSLVINLKTAKALGLTVPPSLLIRADEVIE